MKIGEKKETSLSPIILTTFFAMFCFKLPIHYRPNKFTIFAVYNTCLLFDQEISKIEEKNHGFTAVHLQIFKRKSIFFGVGAFSPNLVGGNLPNRKKKINISREWYRFLKANWMEV